MTIENLYLEVTRNCTLECIHCLRGNRERINMSTQTIDNVFNDIKKIGRLLLTGGEPFLAIQTLEHILEVIKEKNIKISRTSIITNGTVLSERIINLIKELSKYTNVYITLSSDIFHYQELIRLNLLQRRNNNLEQLEKHNINCFRTLKSNEKIDISIIKRGKAAMLTQEYLDEINKTIPQKYYFRSADSDDQSVMTIYKGDVEGIITIDVYGNLVSNSRSFEEEDREAKEKELNVNNMPFEEAITTYIDWHNQELGGIQYQKSKNSLAKRKVKQ